MADLIIAECKCDYFCTHDNKTRSTNSSNQIILKFQYIKKKKLRNQAMLHEMKL